MTHQRETQVRWRSEGRCIICGDPAVPAKRKTADGLSGHCRKHLDAVRDRATAKRDLARRKPVRRGNAKLTLRVLNGHSKDCQPGPVGGRWKVRSRDFAALMPDDARAGGLIPIHRRSSWGDKRGESYRFVLLVCNSTVGCPASALVRLEDIEFAAERILD